MRKHLVSLIIGGTVSLSGCTSSDLPAPGAVVLREQAVQIAQTTYNLSELGDVELRHLNKEEMAQLTPEQKELTPVYFIISGKAAGKNQEVWVSSNNPDHHLMVESD